MKKTELCVLFGGRSSEYEVSLSSACNVLSAIDGEKYNVHKIGIDKRENGIFTAATMKASKITRGKTVI